MIGALLPLATGALQSLTSSAPPPAAASASAGSDFGQFMAQAASDTLKTLKTAEQTSMDGIAGKASAQDVVVSVMNAERGLQTALAIRDKAVAAYQQISQMPI